MSKEPEPKPQEPNENNVEVTPEWVNELKESLSRLPQEIKEALTPDPQDPDPEPLNPDEPIEIPLPQPPEPENPPQPEPMQDPEPEPEPKKKKGFLNWLL